MSDPKPPQQNDDKPELSIMADAKKSAEAEIKKTASILASTESRIGEAIAADINRSGVAFKELTKPSGVLGVLTENSNIIGKVLTGSSVISDLATSARVITDLATSPAFMKAQDALFTARELSASIVTGVTEPMIKLSDTVKAI